MKPFRVVTVFDDVSLGGTSRTAFLLSEMWREAGAEVMMYSPRSPHAHRLAKSSIVHTTEVADLDAAEVDLLHIHHPAPHSELKMWLASLLSQFNPSRTAILTHNVFGYPLELPDAFPVVVGTLGDWVAAQLNAQTGARQDSVRILPNPQDLGYFRPPSAQERINARARLGIRLNEKIVLRIGSPSDAKWSLPDYERLSHALFGDGTGDLQLRLVGAPVALTGKWLNRASKISVTADDDHLRDEYWAADVFALSSKRGESFGNVILEALGCGLPVSYRARPYRDNTPWEFQELGNFRYATSTRRWIRATEDLLEGGSIRDDEARRRLEQYGTRATVELMSAIVSSGGGTREGYRTSAMVAAVLPSPRRLSLVDRLKVGVTHNVVIAGLKEFRRSAMFRGPS